MSNMDLEKLFRPKAMAVIGISRKNNLSPGRIILLKNEFEMNVDVYGIHPQGGNVEGVNLYKSLGDLPVTPDILVIAVGPDDTIGYIDHDPVAFFDSHVNKGTGKAFAQLLQM